MALLLLFTLAVSIIFHLSFTHWMTYSKTNNGYSYQKKGPKPSLAADISQNVPIMHKTLAFREKSKIFRGNQLTQDE